MYAVIFKADVRQFDEDYELTAARMRELAINDYGCVDFIACNEGELEIAISYWNSLEQIQTWKNDPEHLQAQALGKHKWYASYQVQIVEILREYQSPA